MLTPAQHEEFERTGLLRLSGAIPAGDAAAMCDRIWEFLLDQHGIRRNDPATWTVAVPGPLRALSRYAEFDRIGSPVVRSAISDLIGAGRWSPPRKWGRLLVTFPPALSPAWDVPVAGWHNDFTRRQDEPGLRAVQLFAVLNEVRPRGGGTLVLAGSHHLVARYIADTNDDPHPKHIRHVLAARSRWLGSLWGRDAGRTPDRARRFMREGAEVDGVRLRVLELAGEPGDVYLMHCDTFHAIAPNCLDQPRMMATHAVTRELPPAGPPSS